MSFLSNMLQNVVKTSDDALEGITYLVSQLTPAHLAEAQSLINGLVAAAPAVAGDVTAVETAGTVVEAAISTLEPAAHASGGVGEAGSGGEKTNTPATATSPAAAPAPAKAPATKPGRFKIL